MLYISNVFCVSFSSFFFFFFSTTKPEGEVVGAGGPSSGTNLMTHHSSSLVGGDCLEQHLNSGRSELSAAGQEELGISIPALQSLASRILGGSQPR